MTWKERVLIGLNVLVAPFVVAFVALQLKDPRSFAGFLVTGIAMWFVMSPTMLFVLNRKGLPAWRWWATVVTMLGLGSALRMFR